MADRVKAVGETHTIVQYWHSNEVPAEVRELTTTFRDRNPEMRHLLVHEAEAADFIAESFTERELAAFRACAVPAMQSDYFRYCAILALGGVYADVGFACRRPLGPLIGRASGGLLVRLTPGEVIANGFFVFPAPGHPFLRLALDIATANIERRIASGVNRVTGPWIFTCLVEAHRAGSLSAGWASTPAIERLAEAMLVEVEDYTRLTEALEGVRIEPAESLRDWADQSEARLRYKDDDTRWTRWSSRGGSIFR
jgi:mannosyltransferase OCH1-like enzyme